MIKKIVLLKSEEEKDRLDDLEVLSGIVSFEKHFRFSGGNKFSVCLIYNLPCSCKIERFYRLDRYPMSEKILTSCPDCKKHVVAELHKPLIFHCPWNDTDFSLEELKNCYLSPDHNQYNLLQLYYREANEI